MEPGCTSPTFTPPEVIIASDTGRGPVTDSEKFFNSAHKRRRCSFVTELALRSAGISSRSRITSTILR